MFRINTLRRQIVFCGIAFAALALLFGMWSQHNLNPPPKEIALKNGTFLPTPRDIKPFQLSNAHNGTEFTNAQLKGHWSLMFFGFTNCAMLCPTTLTTLSKTYNMLTEAKINALPHVVFISIDPERDTLKRIDQYVKTFNNNFNGATGSKAQLDKLTQDLNILYLKVDPNKDNNYQIDHSGTVLLIDPQGHLAALFSPPIDAQTLADDYQTVIHAKSGEKK